MIGLPAARILAMRCRSARPLRVYLLLAEELDTHRYRPVKVAYLRHILHIRSADARRALQQLVLFGVLDKGPPDETGVNTYRLVWRVPPTPPEGGYRFEQGEAA